MTSSATGSDNDDVYVIAGGESRLATRREAAEVRLRGLLARHGQASEEMRAALLWPKAARALKKRDAIREEIVALFNQMNAAVEVVASAADGTGFRLWIDPGSATSGRVADFLVALSRLHKASGGDGLDFRVAEDGPRE